MTPPSAVTLLTIRPEGPAPQADRLDVVAAVVDAVAGGGLTAAEVADAIGMSGRQGAYYPHAAADLGYLEPVAGTSPVEWQLTDRGEEFLSLDPAGKVADLVEAVNALHYVETYTATDDGTALLVEELSSVGYSDETAHRRAQTISAWVAFVRDTEPGRQVELIGAAVHGTRERAPAVRRAAAERRAHRAPARAQVAPKVCGSCFTTLPLTGRCGFCS